MSRHAYLIAAYNNSFVLSKLLHLIDDERNDIYVHVDKKVKDFDAERFAGQCQHSRLTFVPRTKVFWGDYSQIDSILRMMRVALGHGDYSYIHLLSDSDLPLRSPDRIHRFFDENRGKEFVAFNELSRFGETWVALIHPFNRQMRSRHAVVRSVAARLDATSLRVQRRLGVDRVASAPVEVKYGSDWYSITADLAAHVLSQERTLRRLLRRALIPTEFYVQTVLWNSRFRESVFDPADPYRSNMRMIDFKQGDGRGSPVTWTVAHLPELLEADRIFARKFDAGVDREVIELICSHVLNQEHP